MNRIIATMASAFLVAISVSPITLDTDIPPLPPKVLSVQETIVKYATVYRAPEKKLESLFRCESTFRQNVIGEEGEIGVGQFKPDTFKRLAKLMGEELNIHSYSDQIKLVSWLSVNHPNEMRNWTTWRALQNGGTYTFTSRQTGKTYTVVCK